MNNQDFSFMKSGFGSGNQSSHLENIDENELRQLLSLFLSNAIINAARYVKIGNRNGVTKQDINMGLKYEVREFFNRTTFQNDLEEIKKDYEALENEEPIKFRVEYVDMRTGEICQSEIFDEENLAEDFIVDLEEQGDGEYFSEFTIIELTESDVVMDEMVIDNDSIDVFKKVTIENMQKASQDDRKFISKVHEYDENWHSWEPNTPILMIMKNATTSMMNSTVYN